ncbi:MAG: disulfide bond formation protein DsbA [Gammaproteobacteria bacterium]|nr:MAG: disulfide bond formation protein DsbA [Gammaproteobacteria bacterium]PHR83911.1 MAG: disulfide bond formation protein DsbA [Colwellia sp.]
MSSPLVVDYYSDILCVWAWIAQRRIDELHEKLGNKIELRYHYLDVFGDAINKIPTQWRERGGYDGFSAHVIESAAVYEDAHIHSAIWSKTRPTSSANPHLVLKAIELTYSCQQSINLALQFRQAFFVEAKDISNLAVLFSIIEQAGLDSSRVNKALVDGRAMAGLMRNYQQAKALSLKGSPSYIIDNGRQTLYGNVGYRVLLANIEEQLNKPESEASWC